MQDSKEYALHRFWSSFGLKAYDENTVPDKAMDENNGRYITYSVYTSTFEDPVPLYASLWYRDTSWEEITEKVNVISNYIGYGGRIISYDGGKMWILRGVPFSQRMPDEDDQIRRIYINIMVEFLSVD